MSDLATTREGTVGPDFYDVVVLRAIAHIGGRVQAWRIAERTGLDVRDVRAIVHRLESEGYITRWCGLRVTRDAREMFATALWECRTCGCTDEHACPGGCAWAEQDLCTTCAPPSPLTTKEA